MFKRRRVQEGNAKITSGSLVDDDEKDEGDGFKADVISNLLLVQQNRVKQGEEESNNNSGINGTANDSLRHNTATAAATTISRDINTSFTKEIKVSKVDQLMNKYIDEELQRRRGGSEQHAQRVDEEPQAKEGGDTEKAAAPPPAPAAPPKPVTIPENAPGVVLERGSFFAATQFVRELDLPPEMKTFQEDEMKMLVAMQKLNKGSVRATATDKDMFDKHRKHPKRRF